MIDRPLVDTVINDSPIERPVEPVETAPVPAAADPDPVVAPEPSKAAEPVPESLIERVEHAVLDALHSIEG